MAKDLAAMTENQSFLRSSLSHQFAQISLLLQIQPSFLVAVSLTIATITDDSKIKHLGILCCASYQHITLST